MYTTKSGLIIGFHGCDSDIREKVVNQKNEDLKKSQNQWDWLGSGIYFWENNPHRAEEFAKEEAKRNKTKVKKPCVIGAILDLGYCLDLLDSSNLLQVKDSYEYLKEMYKSSLIPLPSNKNLKETDNKEDRILRELDCAVIELLHSLNERKSSNKKYVRV